MMMIIRQLVLYSFVFLILECIHNNNKNNNNNNNAFIGVVTSFSLTSQKQVHVATISRHRSRYYGTKNTYQQRNHNSNTALQLQDEYVSSFVTTSIITSESASQTDANGLSSFIGSILSTSTLLSNDLIIESQSLSSEESWRQYVPLVVSCFVIIDVLLGNPFVKFISSFVTSNNNDSSSSSSSSSSSGTISDNTKESSSISSRQLYSDYMKVSSERVDSKKIATDAIQKAKYTLELKQFLENNKTNQDRYKDLQKQIDQQINEYDTKK